MDICWAFAVFAPVTLCSRLAWIPPQLQKEKMAVKQKQDKIYLVFSTLVFLIALSSSPDAAGMYDWKHW